jgi:pullulanase/glycogen debranching enzyme
MAHVIVNGWREPLEFELPPVESGWRLMVDTFLPAPDDIRSWEEAPVLETGTYLVNAHSLVFLAAIAPELGPVTPAPEPTATPRAPAR